MTTESIIVEEEGSGGVSPTAVSNSTEGIAKTSPVFGGVVRRKPKKEKAVPTFEEYLMTESGDLRSAAEHWRKDAEIARKQGEPGRWKKSIAEYHRIMAQHAKSEGDETAEKFHKDEQAKALEDAKKLQASFDNAGVYSKTAQQNIAAGRPPGTKIKPYVPPKPPYKRAPANDGKKFYYDVPFSKKDEAKKLGMKWDAEKRAWYSSWIDAETNGPFKRKHV